MRGKGGLSLGTSASLLPLATAAVAAAVGGSGGADAWAQTGLGPSGEVIN